MTPRMFPRGPARSARPLALLMLALMGAGETPCAGQVVPALPPTGVLPLVDPSWLGPVPEAERAGSPVLDAVERAAAGTDDPARARGTLLWRLRYGNTCYPSGLTDGQLDELMRAKLALPPAQSMTGLRYFADTQSWLGDGGVGPSGTSRPAQLTYSFPADGTIWGLTCVGYSTAANNLNAKLTAQFTSLDRGREMIRSALASWRRYCALTLTEVADDGSQCDTAQGRVATRGDVRIGGVPMTTGASAPLAYNAFPASGGITSCGGGDMTINTDFFLGSYFGLGIGNFVYFRNTVAHEFGHGIGYIHSVPCNRTKLMEPFINTSIATVQPDEIRAAIRNYGDRYAGNHTPALARSLGNLNAPNRSAIERDLGLNGSVVSIPGQGFVAQDDWFVFTLSAPSYVRITAAPTGYGPPAAGACCAVGGCVVVAAGNLCAGPFAGPGSTCSPTPCQTPSVTCCRSTTGECQIFAGSTCGSGFTPTGSFTCEPSPCTAGTLCPGNDTDPAYCQGRQTSGCTGGVSAVDATRAGDLALEVRVSSNLNTSQAAFASANPQPVGQAESVEFMSLAAGTYYIRVWDAGGAPAGNQTVQTYDLTVRVGSSAANTYPAPPVAIAGLAGKRVRAGTSSSDAAQFIGFHNSYATEVGASIPNPGGYAWDLDGDGTFETVGNAQPSINYVSNGTFPVTLRVTDSNGLTATDTVQVTVFGATTAITDLTPPEGAQGTTVPVTITGRNFRGVAAASQVTVSGSGVTVTGTPQVNGLGTVITGLSLVIAPGAAPGLRNMTVTNADGQGASGTATQVLTVTAAAGTGVCCAASGSCSIVSQGSCTGSWSAGGACSPNPCPQPSGACCAASGTCSSSTQAACAGAWTLGGSCSPNPCPQPSGACCAASGSCVLTTQSACAGSWSLTPSCLPNPCPQPTGACCTPAGVCSITGQFTCSGAFFGVGTVCSPSPCPRTCCRGSTCVVVAAASCVASGRAGAVVGPGAGCNAAGSATTPCCLANYNGTGPVDLLDIFDYLEDWFGGSPYADFGGPGTAAPDLLDIFAFLEAWFAGGC